MLVGMKRADTWKPLGALTQRIAAKLALRQAEILEKVAAAPTLGSDERSGAVCAVHTPHPCEGGTAVGKSALPPGEMTDRACKDRREDNGLQIGGLTAHTELKAEGAAAGFRERKRATTESGTIPSRPAAIQSVPAPAAGFNLK